MRHPPPFRTGGVGHPGMQLAGLKVRCFHKGGAQSQRNPSGRSGIFNFGSRAVTEVAVWAGLRNRQSLCMSHYKFQSRYLVHRLSRFRYGSR